MHTTTTKSPASAPVTLAFQSGYDVLEARRMAGSIVPTFATFDHAFALQPHVGSQGGMRFDAADPVLHGGCFNSTDLYAYLVSNESAHPAWARAILVRMGLSHPPTVAESLAASTTSLTPETTIEHLRAALAAVRAEFADYLFAEVLETGRCSAVNDAVVLARLNELGLAETKGEG